MTKTDYVKLTKAMVGTFPSKEACAAKLKISVRTLDNWLTGRSVPHPVHRDTIRKLAGLDQ